MVGGDRISLDDALDPQHNSLNFLRLVLASIVLVSHTKTLGGFGREDYLHGTTFGTVAVYGFFGISGYLIAGSASRHSPARYLWQRCLRILPGFWVALIVTSFVFGWLGWLSGHHVGSYLAIPGASPQGFVGNNWFLDMRQFNIGTIGWNGSLWTLFYEFLCYLLLLGASAAGLLRWKTPVLLGALGFWFAQFVITISPDQGHSFNVFHWWWIMNLIKFAAIFLVGSAMYMWRERIPDSGWIALGCTALFAASLILPGVAPAYSFAASDLGAPLVAYPLLWLGAHLPFQRVGAVNDYSYGIYIYAFPVTVLLSIWGATRFGYVPFAVLSLAATFPLAVASWWLIEKRAMALKRLKLQPRHDPDESTLVD